LYFCILEPAFTLTYYMFKAANIWRSQHLLWLWANSYIVLTISLSCYDAKPGLFFFLQIPTGHPGTYYVEVRRVTEMF